MRRMGQESDFKTQLILEICSISARTVVCVHRLLSKTTFVDWYHILGVEENAGTDAIRKRYHKLALQLHPDKNKHPKAEIAFKLVSEAHTCLCDSEKRKAFDLERLKNFCFECKRIPYKSGNATGNSDDSSFKAWNFMGKPKSYKLWRNIKDMRERFKVEAKVIENCMRTNSMSRRESPLYNPTEYLHRSKSQHRVDKEIPVFNPSDYLCQGYPHLRNQVYKNSETFWYLQTENILDNNERGRSGFHTPVFEVRSGRRMSVFTSKCASAPS